MTALRWTTAGESHGPALLGILEGMPFGMPLDVARIDAELARRQGGYGRGGRMRIEEDRVVVQSGLRAGRTLGSPLGLCIVNADATIERLPVPTSARPGHADLAGCQKNGARDPRAVMERASARETAMRTALGAAARQLIERFGVEVFAHVTSLGGIAAAAGAFERAGEARHALRAASAFAALDTSVETRWKACVDRAKEQGDTLGGAFEVVATGLPPGLGGYHSGEERLTSRLGAALFSIPAIKAVEVGVGSAAGDLLGSNFHDAIIARPGPFGRFGRASNRAGGLEGGMTTGEPLVLRVTMKPISTLRRGVPTVDFETGAAVDSVYQRSDVTAVPAASVVGEALVTLELTRAFLAKFGGDSLDAVRASYEAYLASLQRL